MTTFGYDNSDQLTSEVRDNSHSTGYSISYTYDHNQNRLTKVLNGSTDAYTYDSHDKLLTAGSKSYTYDSNGNCTKVTAGTSVTTLSYDDSNRVTGITYPGGGTNAFVYNGEDLRVSKTDSAGASAAVTDGATPASPVLKDSRAVYTPSLSEHAGSASKFYHADALGSTRGITDATQATTDAVLYDAFGMTVSRTGSTATPFGFVGAQQYQTDADSGLQLLGHRYYDASVGRFISSEPAKAGTNWYAYCENGPQRATDPQGLFLQFALAGGGAVAAGGIAITPVGWVVIGVVGVIAIGGGIAWWFRTHPLPAPPVSAPSPAPSPAPQPEPDGPIFDPTPIPPFNPPRYWRGAKPGEPPSLVARPGTDIKPRNGIVSPGKGGLSVVDDPRALNPRYPDPWRVISIPPELSVRQQGNDPHHYVIEPGMPMPADHYQGLLNKIGLSRD